jgi:hypothetical protein
MESDETLPKQPIMMTGELMERAVKIPFPPSFAYSNCAAFSLSSMDFRISFAEVMQDGTAEAKVGIVMPPEQAAMLAMMLLQQLKTFEERFGAIRLPAWRAMQQLSVSKPDEPNPTSD